MQEWWVNITGIYSWGCLGSIMAFRSENVLTAVFFQKIVGDTQFTYVRIQGLN
jgi:hypothetical protein